MDLSNLDLSSASAEQMQMLMQQLQNAMAAKGVEQSEQPASSRPKRKVTRPSIVESDDEHGSDSDYVDSDEDGPVKPIDPNLTAAAKNRRLRETSRQNRNSANSSRDAAPNGSAEASGQIAVQMPRKREPKERAPKKERPKPPKTKYVPCTISKQVFDAQRSDMPLWMLANYGLADADRYPRPPDHMGYLHRPVCGNMSRFMRGDPRQIAVAAVAMELSTVVPKMADKFGAIQIPLEHGGGPFYVAAETYAPFPVSYDLHGEVHVKGVCQISKSPEQGMCCWFLFFVVGVFPVLYIRNKGGGTVGTADAEEAVITASEEVIKTWLRIRHRYPTVNIDPDELFITPVCTSRGKAVEMASGNSYKLTRPQCLVSCTNMTQLSLLTEPPQTSVAIARAAGSGQPLMPLLSIFQGMRRVGDPEHANPYLPFIDDPELLGCGDGRGRLLSSTAMILDEDDTNKSSTGREAKDTMLFQTFPHSEEMLQALQNLRPDDEDPSDAVSESGMSEKKEDNESDDFYKTKIGLRAHVAKVITFSATPTVCMYKSGTEASPCNEISVTMIEMRPSPNYVAYPTRRMIQRAPWIRRWVQIVEVEDRCTAHSAAKKLCYPRVFNDLGIDVESDGYPLPFRQDKRGTVSLRGDKETLIMTNRGELSAQEIFDAVESMQKLTSQRCSKFWYCDGNNVVRMLEDAEVNREMYPEGYRNMLVYSNFTRQNIQVENWVSTILGLHGTEVQDGALCADGDLVNDLICLIWTHKKCSFSWNVGEVDEELFQAAIDSLKDLDAGKGDYASIEAREFAMGCVWGLESDDDNNDDTIGNRAMCVASPVPNINYAYSVLYKYLELKKEADALAGSEGTFLKILVFAGEIGGRGARYKTHGTHKFVLTDQSFAFDVKTDAQMVTHAAGAIQASGRLNGMVPDTDTLPPIKLWIPRSCSVYLMHWMNVMDEIPPLVQLKQEGETMEDVIERVCMDDDGLGLHAIRTHFASTQGVGKNGAKYFARLDHQIQKGKQISTHMHSKAAEEDVVPDAVPIVDRTEEFQEKHMAACAKIASERIDKALDVDPDDLDDQVEGQMSAALGAPVLEGRSVPMPRRRKIAMPDMTRKGKKRGRKGPVNKTEYNFTTGDTHIAHMAIAEMETLRNKYNVRIGTGVTEVDPAFFMVMFSAWYKYLMCMENASRGKPAAPEVRDFGHGIRSHGSRKNYVKSIDMINGIVGKTYFKSLSDLPQGDLPKGKARDDEKARVYSVIERMMKQIYPHYWADDSVKSQDLRHKCVDNMFHHLNKWTTLFPQCMDIRYFLINEPTPSRNAPSKSIFDTEEAGSSSATVVEEEPNQSDSDGCFTDDDDDEYIPGKRARM